MHFLNLEGQHTIPVMPFGIPDHVIKKFGVLQDSVLAMGKIFLYGIIVKFICIQI